MRKPPLGMVPYLPTHNHYEETPCAKGCPTFDWNEHVRKWGSPYPTVRPGPTEADVIRLLTDYDRGQRGA